MYRVEIIANQSVQEDILDALEVTVKNIFYTIIPTVYGKGGENRKLGTSTWPETNFLLVSYIEDGFLEPIKAIIKAIKMKFPDEGIKMFVIKSED